MLVASAVMSCGCSIRHDPHYNSRVPPEGPTLLEAAESIAEACDDALDRVDAWAETVIY